MVLINTSLFLTPTTFHASSSHWIYCSPVIKHLISAPCTWIGHCGQPMSTVAVPPCAGSADQSHPEISAGLQKAGSPAAGKCIRHAKETQIVGYSRWAQRQSFAPMTSVFKYRKEDG